jgi:phenylalanyl-tRNA synthetase beta chain
MLDMGQPLHMFDAEKIDGEIIVRKAKAGEKIVLLTGDEVTLNENDLVIADNTGPLAIAGVKGGKRAEVNSSTKKILIEAANFEPSTVRKTSTRLNLRNDSSKRFENEITPDFAEIGMDDAVALIVSILPDAKILARQDIYPKPVTKWNVTVSPEYISSLCGIAVSGDDIEKIMKTMGCDVEKTGNDLKITPPLERLDLVIPEDIVMKFLESMGMKNYL